MPIAVLHGLYYEWLCYLSLFRLGFALKAREEVDD